MDGERDDMPDPVIKLIIPARNEDRAIAKVLAGVIGRVDQVIVADNGSTDRTAAIAKECGASVVHVPEPGYGRACLAAIEVAGDCDILVFMDGDASDDPADLAALLAPILANESDLVIGSRILGECDPGSLTVQQRFGNTLACWLMHLIWGFRFSDLGPFRAIRKSSYDQLNMEAPTFGWTVEMQVRALKQNLRCAEIPVHYRKRIGVSKISGTVKGVILAGWYILGTIAIEALKRNQPKIPDLRQDAAEKSKSV